MNIQSDISDPLPLAILLMAEASISPQAAGCYDLMAGWLEKLEFRVLRRHFEPGGEAFYAIRRGRGPNLCFAGHVDVVPPGRESAWHSPPFVPEVREGVLYGRGAEDMKGAIACMVAAVARYLGGGPDDAPTLSFLLVADEESAGYGTRAMLEWLKEQGEALPDFCLVGEPTNPEYIGEMAKTGRRGSLNAMLTVRGKQGHVAYPALADNPVTRLVAMLHALKSTPIDEGMEFFQSSNLEVTTIDVGNPVTNTIPAEAKAAFNIRFNALHTSETMTVWVRERCASVGGDYELDIRVTGEAFLSPPGLLSQALLAAVAGVTGHTPRLTTDGGTSDARFIREYCPVIEFGTTNRTAHHVNECVRESNLHALADVYTEFLRQMAGTCSVSP